MVSQSLNEKLYILQKMENYMFFKIWFLNPKMVFPKYGFSIVNGKKNIFLKKYFSIRMESQSLMVSSRI